MENNLVKWFVLYFFCISFVSSQLNGQPINTGILSQNITGMNVTVLEPNGANNVVVYWENFSFQSTNQKSVVLGIGTKRLPENFPYNQMFNHSLQVSNGTNTYYIDQFNNSLAYLGRSLSLNVTANISSSDTLFVNRTINPFGNYVALNNKGTTTYLNAYAVNSPLGEQQYVAQWIPTVGNGGNHIGNYFQSYINTTGISWGATSKIVGTQFESTIYAPKTFTPFPSLVMTGMFFNSSIIGSQSGAQFWSGGITGVQNDVNILGTWSSVAGANFFPIVYTVTFNASASLSHQISGLNSRTIYNAPNTVNQIYGFQSSASAGSGANVAGNLNAIYGIVSVDQGVRLTNNPNIFQAYIASSDGSTWNNSIASGKKYIAFWANDASGRFVIPNRTTVSFSSNLPFNETNYAFESEGANAIMNYNGSKWIFGTRRSFNISYNSGSGQVEGNLNETGNITIMDNLIFTNLLWDDVVAPIAGLKLPGTNPAVLKPFRGSAVIQEIGFEDKATNSEESASGSLQLPHSIKVDYPFECHIHWSPSDTTSGNVNWTLFYTFANVSQVFPVEKQVSIICPSGGVAWSQNLCTFGNITNGDISGMMAFAIQRSSGTVGDTYNAQDAFATSFDCHVAKDTFGSKTIDSKF